MASQFSEAALQKVREDRLLIDRVDLWLYEEIAPFLGTRVLEIGCGHGSLARHFNDRELYIGIDISAESVERVNQDFRNQANMSACVADVTDPSFAEFARYQFDTVLSSNVFEHIEDHLAALRNAAAVLQPSGHFILIVPAHRWLYGSIDRAIGHHRRYDKALMADLFHQAGLHVAALKYINALGALGWFANGRLRRQETPPSGQLRLFNSIVPFIKGFERLIPPPFGISLIAVGRPRGPG